MIDDDERLCDKMKQYLASFSLDLGSFHTPAAGIEAVKNGNYDVLILDGMLPGMDGTQVCREIRQFSTIPIIFLTGRVEEADKILGLESGADDYITKPFSPRELVARINSQLRRFGVLAGNSTAAIEKKTLEEQDLELNSSNYLAFYKKTEIKFTATEFEILKFLMEHKGHIVAREEIMQGIHGDTWEAFDRSLDIAISRIRKKLNSVAPEVEFIKTVRLKGYLFVSE